MPNITPAELGRSSGERWYVFFVPYRSYARAELRCVRSCQRSLCASRPALSPHRSLWTKRLPIKSTPRGLTGRRSRRRRRRRTTSRPPPSANAMPRSMLSTPAATTRPLHTRAHDALEKSTHAARSFAAAVQVQAHRLVQEAPGANGGDEGGARSSQRRGRRGHVLRLGCAERYALL